MVAYNYEIFGFGAGEQPWKTNGTIATMPGSLPDVFAQAMRETFQKLTQGKAEYGHPGVGCSGPYRITRLVIEDAEATGA
jgi:hypothetical protein